MNVPPLRCHRCSGLLSPSGQGRPNGYRLLPRGDGVRNWYVHEFPAQCGPRVEEVECHVTKRSREGGSQGRQVHRATTGYQGTWPLTHCGSGPGSGLQVRVG